MEGDGRSGVLSLREEGEMTRVDVDSLLLFSLYLSLRNFPVSCGWPLPLLCSRPPSSLPLSLYFGSLHPGPPSSCPRLPVFLLSSSFPLLSLHIRSERNVSFHLPSPFLPSSSHPIPQSCRHLVTWESRVTLYECVCKRVGVCGGERHK